MLTAEVDCASVVEAANDGSAITALRNGTFFCAADVLASITDIITLS